MILMIIIGLLLVTYAIISKKKGADVRKIADQFKTDYPVLPLVGHGTFFIGSDEDRMKSLILFSQQALKHDGWTKLIIGGKLHAVVGDAVEAEYVSKYHLEKDDNITQASEGLVKEGLIFAPVKKWRPRRKILTPAFKRQNLNKFVDTFNNCGSIMLDRLSDAAGRGNFSIWPYVTSYTMDVVANALFGFNCGFQKSKHQDFMKSFEEYSTIIARRLVIPWLYKEINFKYLCYFGMYADYQRCIKHLKEFVRNILKDKRDTLKKNDARHNENKNIHNDKKSFRPFVEVFIEETDVDEIEIIDGLIVILTAATDSTSVSVCFAMMNLARYPDIQEKAYHEIQEVIGDSKRPINVHDLRKLTYLRAVIKENLRMYPPAPMTARKITYDDVTPSGIKLTAGMGILISHYAAGYDPKYWGQDVNVFRPERMFEGFPTNPAAFLPFGTGPRNCIGFEYAMMSMTTLLALTLRRYHILPADGDKSDKPFRVTFQLLMKSLDQFPVKLELRT